MKSGTAYQGGTLRSGGFGVLTLATPDDWQKAIGLALSLRVSNPGVPIAVACAPRVGRLLAPWFDYIVEENPALRGFEHKVHLDRYSPFAETFFFDSDVLVFRPLSEVLDAWRVHPYTACGIYVDGGISSFGLDRDKVMRRIRRDRFVQIDGAGHAYFRKPDCTRVFDLAREITRDYRDWAGDIMYADEDAVDIAMTLLDLPPMPPGDFFSRYCSARRGTMEMDATRGLCRFVAATDGRVQQPHMMHFAANEAAFQYARQLYRLFRKFGVDTRGLFSTAVGDFYVGEILWPVKKTVKQVLSVASFSRKAA